MKLSRQFAGALCAGMAASVGACGESPASADDGRGPASGAVVQVQPRLSELRVGGQLFVEPRLNGGVRWEHDPIPIETAGPPIAAGMLSMHASPAELHFDSEIPVGARIRVTVTTDHGDVEELWLRGPEGSCRNEPYTKCRMFQMVLENVSAAYPIVPQLNNLPARYASVLVEPDATVHAYAVVLSGDVGEAIRSARRWPGVRSAGLVHILRTMGGGPITHGFSGAMPAEAGPAVPGDGVLQVSDGTRITVRYEQPDGSVLTASATM